MFSLVSYHCLFQPYPPLHTCLYFLLKSFRNFPFFRAFFIVSVYILVDISLLIFLAIWSWISCCFHHSWFRSIPSWSSSPSSLAACHFWLRWLSWLCSLVGMAPCLLGVAVTACLEVWAFILLSWTLQSFFLKDSNLLSIGHLHLLIFHPSYWHCLLWKSSHFLYFLVSTCSWHIVTWEGGGGWCWLGGAKKKLSSVGTGCSAEDTVIKLEKRLFLNARNHV